MAKSGSKRKSKTVRLDNLVPTAARRAFRAFGFVEASVITHWADIVGEAMAAHSLPERLRFAPGKRRGGTLHVRVDHAFGLELQHLAPIVIERVNTYFGYAAVERLALKQGPLPERAAPAVRREPVLTDAERARIEDAVAGVTDSRLKESLARLGAEILGRA